MTLLSFKPRRPLYGNTVCENITFLHPGYPDGHNILFMLPALDGGGFHHETARVACAILANSQWDGFLTTTRDGDAIAEGKDDILLGKEYYFRIQNNDHYAVVPDFETFRCPATLPDSWGTNLIGPATNIDTRNRDQACRVTASLLSNEIAHIIPQAQSVWWQRNSMFKYTINPSLSSDTRCADNAILLRRDLHKSWDDHCFAIVPKVDKWVIHVLWKGPSDELETKYHNLELQPLSGVARHFLFCRFALAIISKSIFLSQNVPRKLVTLDSEGRPQERSISANDYRKWFPPVGRANSRSQSPKKRQRSDNGEVDAGWSDEILSGSDEENDRGRRRKRSESLDYCPPTEERPKESVVRRKRQRITPPRSSSPKAS